jgi:tetratricopeptide (TPR) repeat protein
MSIPSENPPVPSAPAPPPPKAGLLGRRRRWVIWIMLLVVVGGCLISQTPREIGRWELAAALNARDAGRKEEAYTRLEKAQRWFPDNPILLLQRAEWRLADGDRPAALEDVQRMVELSGESVASLMYHSQFLQDAGQFGDAVKDWKKLNQMSERNARPDRASALNGLAYAQALAEIELDEALDHVNEALELSQGRPSFMAAASDTRGYLLYLTERYEAALADMNAAVRGYESEIRPPLPHEQRAASRPTIPDSRPKTVRDLESPDLARVLAVVRYHRALVLKALGRDKEAGEDLARVRQLIGREPDQTLF